MAMSRAVRLNLLPLGGFGISEGELVDRGHTQASETNFVKEFLSVV